MKFVFLLGLVALASASLTDQEQWEAFKLKYGRTYNEHESIRFEIFQQNLRIAERLQVTDPTATWGVTRFMDLTPAEFKQQYANLNVSKLVEERDREGVPLVHESFDYKLGTNWRGKAVTSVKNQGQCGSCWTFSATGAMEGCWAVKGHGLVPMSESNIMDCMPNNNGCRGGDPRAAITWAARNGGLMKEASYPYVPAKQTCKQSTPRFGPTTGAVGVAKSESAIRAALQVAPLSICVDSRPLQYYQGGLISAQCGSRTTDHAVLLVADDGNAYTFKNSWGGWGESGYFRTVQGSNCLGMTDYVNRAC